MTIGATLEENKKEEKKKKEEGKKTKKKLDYNNGLKLATKDITRSKLRQLAANDYDDIRNAAKEER